MTDAISSGEQMVDRIELGLIKGSVDFEKYASDVASRILNSAEAKTANQSIECNTSHMKKKHPAEAIVEAAKETHCDLIVMATHGRRGMRRLLLGSQATEVLATSDRPVLGYK